MKYVQPIISNGTHAIEILPVKTEYLYYTCPDINVCAGYEIETMQKFWEYVYETFIPKQIDTYGEDWRGFKVWQVEVFLVAVDEDSNERIIDKEVVWI